MCETCKAEGKGLKAIELALSIEMDNGVKEIPMRLFGNIKEDGLHLAFDHGQREWISALMKDVIPILTQAFAEGGEFPPALLKESKIVLM